MEKGMLKMTTSLHLRRKRELLASALFWSGSSHVVSRLPEQDSLVILNYHRIGNADDDPFLTEMFSATADQFHDQVSCLKRSASLVSLEEALAFADGTIKEKSRRLRVLITFDDGYLDNYEIAFPILRSYGVEGVFFLATSMVGSSQIPWWDRIAYLIRNSRKRRFTLRYPTELTVNLDQNSLAESLEAVLDLYKGPRNSDPTQFIRELEEQTRAREIPNTSRRFLSWEEAREMTRCGMKIGSHTHSHTVLSQLSPAQQLEELTKSGTILKERLGAKAEVLAYPVGSRHSFNDETKRIAREAGYRAAFSFYGGTNQRANTSPYDIKRIFIGPQSLRRFNVQTKFCRHLGKFWP
ncbi:MAG: polysaccharide deacetylase family protein [Terracidiphilus sp.]